MIQKVTIQDDFEVLVKLLNDSFTTVANDFGLTKENCPTNNAFITSEDLKLQLTKNREFFYYKNDDSIIGFIAIEKSNRDELTFYIEKVAVHPDFRHKNIGKELMLFAEDRIKIFGGNRISIGLIDSNDRLKEWYQKQGYGIVETKSYAHLPFDVCMMEKEMQIKTMKLSTDRTYLVPINKKIIDAISNDVSSQFTEYCHNDEWPENDLKEALPVFKELLDKNGNDGFNLWLIIEKENNLIIGSAGFVGQPDSEGNIEIGFGIIPSRRRKGHCTESIKPLLKWGLEHNKVKSIIARCEKSNIASAKTIFKLGFQNIREEDNLLIWKLEK